MMSNVAPNLSDWKVLSNTLEFEVSLHKKLIQATEDERGAILRRELSALSEITKIREELIDEIREITQKRLQLAKDLGLNPRLRLSLQLGSVPESLRETISRNLNLLRETIEEESKVFEQQQSLVTFAQRVAGGLLSFFKSTAKEPLKAYNKKGKLPEESLLSDVSKKIGSY